MTGIPSCRRGSARIVRELMLRAGLDERSAARALEIDRETMHGYASGREVPMPVVFTLLMLADIRPHLPRT